MNSNKNTTIALGLVLNLIIFDLSSTCVVCLESKPPKHKPHPPPRHRKLPPSQCPSPRRTPPPPHHHHHHHHPPPPPPLQSPPPPPPSPPPPSIVPPPPPIMTPCPRDALQFGVCSVMLGGLVNYTIGTPPKTPCCSFMEGMADFEAAICLCTAIKANILGVKISIPISITFLLNVCTKTVPPNFQCA